MIKRLIPKKEHRAIGIQYDGTNYIELFDFCNRCFKTSYGDLQIHLNGVTKTIHPTDWLIKLNDNDIYLLSDKIVDSIYNTGR